MEQRTFEVRSIHCRGCERAIRGALEHVEGVGTVDPDARTNQVDVRFDPEQLGERQIRDRLADAGFPVVGSAAGDGDQEGGGGATRYLLLVVAVAVVSVAGYSGYVLYPRFDLPGVEGAAVLGLAAAAGVASFFSPCSFPLLMGILGRQATTHARDGQAASRPLVFGGAMALGAGVFLSLAGVFVALGGGALFEQVTFASPAGIAVRSVVGVVLVILGLVQVGAVPTPFHAVERAAQPMMRRQARVRRKHPVAGHALFGFGYVLAGFG